MLAQAIRRRLGKAAKEEKGFTLIELLAVVVILGIIAVIAIPMIGGLINGTKDKSDLATARQIYEAARLYVTTEKDGNIGTANINVIGSAATTGATPTAEVFGLQLRGYLEDPLILPSTKTEITSGTVFYVNNQLRDPADGVAVTITAGTGTNAVTKTYTKTQILETKLN